MKTAAFIFDVDGTLAETEESHRHAFNATFAAAGLVGIGIRHSMANSSRSPAEKSGFGPSLTALTPGMRCPKRESRFSTAKRRKLTPISSHVEAFA